MSTRTETKHDPRKLKLAEAGILFVLILGVVIAVGVNISSRNENTEVAEAIVVEETALMEESVVVAAEPVEPEQPGVVEVTVTEPAPLYADNAPASEIYRDGEAAYRDKAYDEAVDIFAVYTERRPENAWGFYMYGLSQWKAGAAEEAEISLRVALDIAPDHTKSLVNLARVLLTQGRADDALPVVAAAAGLMPGDAGIMRLTGRVLHNLDRRDEAIDAYHEALAVDLDDAWSLNNLGLLLIETDRCDEALAPLARAVTLAADNAIFQNNLGMALERTGHSGQAVAAYTAALAADANYAKADVSLARVEEVADAQTDATPVDLIAMAATFTVTPEAAIQTVAEINAEPEVAISDIEQ